MTYREEYGQIYLASQHMRPNPFGHRFKAERERIELTQAALADKIGCAKQTVQNWEKEGDGWTAPDAVALDVCARLGIDVQYIITGKHSDRFLAAAEGAGVYNVDPSEIELIKRYRQLDQHKRGLAMEILGAMIQTGKRKGGAS